MNFDVKWRNRMIFARALVLFALGCGEAGPPAPPERPPVIDPPEPDEYDTGDWIEDEY